jgi:hypothetical protein
MATTARSSEDRRSSVIVLLGHTQRGGNPRSAQGGSGGSPRAVAGRRGGDEEAQRVAASSAMVGKVGFGSWKRFTHLGPMGLLQSSSGSSLQGSWIKIKGMVR